MNNQPRRPIRCGFADGACVNVLHQVQVAILHTIALLLPFRALSRRPHADTVTTQQYADVKRRCLPTFVLRINHFRILGKEEASAVAIVVRARLVLLRQREGSPGASGLAPLGHDVIAPNLASCLDPSPRGACVVCCLCGPAPRAFCSCRSVPRGLTRTHAVAKSSLKLVGLQRQY